MVRPPRRWLTPGPGTAMPPPPRLSGGGARGPEAPPHSPPPLPLRPKSGRRQTEEMAAPHPPRRGRCTRVAGAPRPKQAPARPARCRLTADWRRPGRRERSGPIRGRPGEDGGANQGGGVPPPTPPPAPPPQLGSHRSGPRPSRSRGDAPPPPEGTATRGGGMLLDLHNARPSAPSCLLPRGSRPQGEPTPACWSNARTKLGGGARRRTGTVWRLRPT